MFNINLDSKLKMIRNSEAVYYSRDKLEELVCCAESVFERGVYHKAFQEEFSQGINMFQGGIYLEHIKNADFENAAKNVFSYDFEEPIDPKVMRQSDYFQYVVSIDYVLKLLSYHYNTVRSYEMRERISTAFLGLSRFKNSMIKEAKKVVGYDPSDNDAPHTLFWETGVLPNTLSFYETKKEIENKRVKVNQ